IDLPKYLDPNPWRLFDFEEKIKMRIDFWQHLHSIYLQILVEYGWIGFALWAWGIALIVSPCFVDGSLKRDHLAWASFISITAFLVHNSVDILFVNSLDLIFACHLVIAGIL